MAKMKIPGNVGLGLLDRLMLLGTLPKEGDFVTLKVVRELRESLSFSEEELKEYEIRQVGEQVFWNDKGRDYKKQVHMGERAFDLIADELKKLNDEKKLIDGHMNVYEMFVEQGKAEPKDK